MLCLFFIVFGRAGSSIVYGRALCSIVFGRALVSTTVHRNRIKYPVRRWRPRRMPHPCDSTEDALKRLQNIPQQKSVEEEKGLPGYFGRIFSLGREGEKGEGKHPEYCRTFVSLRGSAASDPQP